VPVREAEAFDVVDAVDDGDEAAGLAPDVAAGLAPEDAAGLAPEDAAGLAPEDAAGDGPAERVADGVDDGVGVGELDGAGAGGGGGGATQLPAVELKAAPSAQERRATMGTQKPRDGELGAASRTKPGAHSSGRSSGTHLAASALKTLPLGHSSAASTGTQAPVCALVAKPSAHRSGTNCEACRRRASAGEEASAGTAAAIASSTASILGAGACGGREDGVERLSERKRRSVYWMCRFF